MGIKRANILAMNNATKHWETILNLIYKNV